MQPAGLDQGVAVVAGAAISAPDQTVIRVLSCDLSFRLNEAQALGATPRHATPRQVDGLTMAAPRFDNLSLCVARPGLGQAGQQGPAGASGAVRWEERSGGGGGGGGGG